VRIIHAARFPTGQEERVDPQDFINKFVLRMGCLLLFVALLFYGFVGSMVLVTGG